MTIDTVTHIPEDRIIQIVADGRGAAPDEQVHLDRCGHCRNMMAELAGDLSLLRQQAARAAPDPERRFVLPAAQPATPRLRRWGWAAAGTALSAVLLVMVILAGREGGLPGLSPQTQTTVQWEDPELVKINMLAENALPDVYLDLSESLDGGYDEGFIDFLIPPLDDDSVS